MITQEIWGRWQSHIPLSVLRENERPTLALLDWTPFENKDSGKSYYASQEKHKR